MKKEEVLSNLKSAKSAHVKWLEKAELVINGLDLQDSVVPVAYTECKFGKWFYGNGQILKGLSNNPIECMQNIEELHIDFHDKYSNIFNIYFSETKKTGFFSKLLGLERKKEIGEVEVSLAKDCYLEMEIISSRFIEEIDRLDRRLGAVSSEKIEALELK